MLYHLYFVGNYKNSSIYVVINLLGKNIQKKKRVVCFTTKQETNYQTDASLVRG